MNQVAQHRLMISEGMRGGANILHVSVINLGIGWVCVCVSVCAHMSRGGLLQLIIRLRCDTPLPHPLHTHMQGTMGFSSPLPDDESR